MSTTSFNDAQPVVSSVPDAGISQMSVSDLPGMSAPAAAIRRDGSRSRYFSVAGGSTAATTFAATNTPHIREFPQRTFPESNSTRKPDKELLSKKETLQKVGLERDRRTSTLSSSRCSSKAIEPKLPPINRKSLARSPGGSRHGLRLGTGRQYVETKVVGQPAKVSVARKPQDSHDILASYRDPDSDSMLGPDHQYGKLLLQVEQLSEQNKQQQESIRELRKELTHLHHRSIEDRARSGPSSRFTSVVPQRQERKETVGISRHGTEFMEYREKPGNPRSSLHDPTAANDLAHRRSRSVTIGRTSPILQHNVGLKRLGQSRQAQDLESDHLVQYVMPSISPVEDHAAFRHSSLRARLASRDGSAPSLNESLMSSQPVSAEQAFGKGSEASTQRNPTIYRSRDVNAEDFNIAFDDDDDAAAAATTAADLAASSNRSEIAQVNQSSAIFQNNRPLTGSRVATSFDNSDSITGSVRSNSPSIGSAPEPTPLFIELNRMDIFDPGARAFFPQPFNVMEDVWTIMLRYLKKYPKLQLRSHVLAENICLNMRARKIRTNISQMNRACDRCETERRPCFRLRHEGTITVVPLRDEIRQGTLSDITYWIKST